MMYRAPDNRWRLCYNSFHRSKPFLGLKYHQLCIGPFIWEWCSGKLLTQQ